MSSITRINLCDNLSSVKINFLISHIIFESILHRIYTIYNRINQRIIFFSKNIICIFKKNCFSTEIINNETNRKKNNFEKLSFVFKYLLKNNIVDKPNILFIMQPNSFLELLNNKAFCNFSLNVQYLFKQYCDKLINLFNGFLGRYIKANEKFDFSINMTCLYNDFQNSRSGWFQLESLSYVRSIQVIKVSKIHSSNAINKIYLEFNPDIKEVKKKSKSENSNLLELISFHEYTNIYNYQVNSLTYDETMIYRIAGGYLNDYFFYLKETNNSPWKARWKNLIHKTTERIKNFIEASLNEILYTEISISEKIKFNNYFDSHKVYFNKTIFH
ncbi:hypothetical protein BNATCHR1100 (nucleomorph) [Bigelowiella natans]|uniref:Uncharacterized protein n=1 Tax=Bigelowiella natans TaxID=227086 RepID=Q3LWH9_BIGNA|nr:hypothetical protein BNATCHR1100 [Bigelowiella natans]ABA27187.1 hypothetical protein [Bigelowiella natans]